MKMFGRKQTRNSRPSLRGRCGTLAFSLVFLVLSPQWIHAQAADQDNVAQQIQQLTDAMAKVQAQVEQSQHQLDEMRKELNELRSQMPQSEANATTAHADSAQSPSSASSAGPAK